MNVAVFLKEGEGRLLLLERGKITTAGEIKQMMLDNLSIPKTASHMFAVWFISPHLGKLSNWRQYKCVLHSEKFGDTSTVLELC